MRGYGLIVAIWVITLFGLQAGALQSTMTEEDYDAAMQEVRLTAGDADGHIDARYFPELEEDGRALASVFEQVEAFWKARDTQQAADIARSAVDAANALTAAAARDDRNAARSAFQTLQGTCQACHEDFRERTEEGFRIKPGV